MSTNGVDGDKTGFWSAVVIGREELGGWTIREVQVDVAKLKHS